MEPSEKPRPSRAPHAAVQLMIWILIVIALVAIYANVQRNRRDKIESVTIKVRGSPSPTQSPRD